VFLTETVAPDIPRSHQEYAMSHPRSIVTIACMAAALAGCQPEKPDPYAKYELGDARTVVTSCIDSMGGLEAWNETGVLRGKAVVSIFDQEGTAYTNTQTLEIRPKAGTIHAEARSARGWWTADVDIDGNVSFTDHEGLGMEMKRALAWGLGRTLHTVRGPMNLLWGPERPQGVAPTTAAGVPARRVPVAGDPRNAVAYYFDPNTNRLLLIASGADEPGQRGTVTTVEYERLAGGLVFPMRIRVFRIGRHVLLGDAPLLDVQFLQQPEAR